MQRFPEFAEEMRTFLDAEAAGLEGLPPSAAAVVRGLRIESVVLLRPDHPRDGMIYFHETEVPNMLWRGDLVDGHPTDLRADT